MEINTMQGFNIIKILNKLGLKDKIVEVIDQVTELNARQQEEYKKLSILMVAKNENYRELDDKEQSKLSAEVLAENPEVSEALSKVDREEKKIGASLLMDFIERLPQAEEEVYRCLGSIYGIKEEEVKLKGLDWTVNAIKEIATSETFQAFFNLATK